MITEGTTSVQGQLCYGLTVCLVETAMHNLDAILEKESREMRGTLGTVDDIASVLLEVRDQYTIWEQRRFLSSIEGISQEKKDKVMARLQRLYEVGGGFEPAATHARLKGARWTKALLQNVWSGLYLDGLVGRVPMADTD